MAVAVIAWASAFVVIRWIGGDFDPGPLALGRLAIGSLALGALLAVRGSWHAPSTHEWRLIALCGLTWFAMVATHDVGQSAATRSEVTEAESPTSPSTLLPICWTSGGRT